MGWFLLLPDFIRNMAYWWVNHNPHRLKQMTGTVTVTAIGMFGNGGGWGLGNLTVHNLSLVIGGLTQKPGVVNGEIAIRDMLNLTLSFNHDVIDGAPAARFANRLVELIESGYGLDDGDIAKFDD